MALRVLLDLEDSSADGPETVSVLVGAASLRSRGFGYVTFQGEVPEGVIDKDHLIDGRMCGARLYKSTRTAFGVCAFLSLPI